MRIDIDQETCIGAGQCVLTAPEVFTQDDDGFSELLPGHETNPGAPSAAADAAKACPVQAISVTED